jgi:N-acyl-D-aspartate/D-glutamate deacylase/CubicO group peptidase (beta-lactamase class C family)
MRNIFFVLLALPFFTSAQLTEKINRIDSAISYLYQHRLFNGAILIGEKGKILYKKTFGTSSASGDQMLTTTSSFNLASVSKQFFAIMIMMLKEQGKLQYDDPVQKYLSSFPYNNITIRHLMNHTSGLPEYFDIASHNMNLLDTLTNESMLALLAIIKPPLVFQPGEKWQYCNTNYTTLASLIEKISGEPCDIFFREHITGPLKMKNTFIYNLKMKSYPASRVFGFHYEKGVPMKDDLLWLDGIVGDGNIYSSVEDLYKWDQALYTEKLVKKTTFEEAITSGKLNNGKNDNYGFAWFIDSPGFKIHHTGSWVGFRNIIVRYVEKNQTIIILDNSTNIFSRNIVQNIVEGKPFLLPETALITNIQLIDGTGVPAKKSAVRMLNDRIDDIGNLTPFPNESVIDGHGLTLAPGFIDSHSHHAGSLAEAPDAVAVTSQGVTTVVSGQDGFSDPVDTLKAMLKNHPSSINVATYTGHAFLREQVMGKNLLRAASQPEIDAMKKLLADDIQKGSLGLSSGLEYEEGFYSTTSEVIDLAKTAASNGGRYISHIRSEDINLERSIEEIIEIGRQAKIPVQISHFKIAMRGKWGNAADILARLEKARAEGIDITADCYPYTMWSSTPRVLFPKKDFTNIESANFATSELIDPSASVMTYFPSNKNYEGKSISEIAKMNNETTGQALIDIIKEAYPTTGNGTLQGAAIVGASMSDDDVISFLKWNYTNVCSDGSNGGHPRGYGTFPRVLGRYVREKKIMPLETAIYKMTGLTAEHLGINDRGIIAQGNFADLVLFDPSTIIDNATITNSTALSTGIEMVWVNGKLVYNHGKATHEHPGRFISK